MGNVATYQHSHRHDASHSSTASNLTPDFPVLCHKACSHVCIKKVDAILSQNKSKITYSQASRAQRQTQAGFKLAQHGHGCSVSWSLCKCSYHDHLCIKLSSISSSGHRQAREALGKIGRRQHSTIIKVGSLKARSFSRRESCPLAMDLAIDAWNGKSSSIRGMASHFLLRTLAPLTVLFLEFL